MTDPDPTLTAITLDDHLDIIEAGELLGFIQTWLAHAPPEVYTDLERHAWPSTAADISQELTALSAKLTGQPQP